MVEIAVSVKCTSCGDGTEQYKEEKDVMYHKVSIHMPIRLLKTTTTSEWVKNLSCRMCNKKTLTELY